jgi:hypothetical protein
VGSIRLADDDATRDLHALGHDAVGLGDAVRIELRSVRAAQAGDGLEVLDRHRQPVERRQVVAAHHRGLGGPRRRPRAVHVDGEIGIESRVEPFDPREHGVHDLDG